MKKMFVEPVVEIIAFSTEDVLTTSAAFQDVGDIDWGIDKPKSE